MWIFAAEDMATVVAELDDVEEYRPGQEATNLYNRRVIECVDDQSRSLRAFTYIYGREFERGSFTRVEPSYSWEARRLALWPEGVDW